jgi:predicted nucleic acid-binding protein
MKSALIDSNSIVQNLISGDLTFVKAKAEYDRLVLPMVILLEITFVLEKVYRLPRIEIVEKLRKIIVDPKIDAERSMYFYISEIYRTQTPLSIVDCYLLIQAKELGIDLISLDKKLKRKIKI